MRLYSGTILCAIATLLISVSTASKTTGSHLSTRLPLPIDKPENNSLPRFLRVSTQNTENGENRVISAGLEKLTDLAKAGVSKINLGSWISKDPPAEPILRRFKLTNGMDDALASPNLKALENYVKELNTQNNNNKASVIGMFMAHYGDDAVANALVTAQRTGDELNTIQRLRHAQLLSWLQKRKSVDDVFTLLKLRSDGYLALASPKMEVLDDYMKLVISTKSTKDSLLKTLTKGFGGEEQLATILARAREDVKTRELASALQNTLINKWVRVDLLRPKHIYKKLRLNRGLDALLDRNVHTFGAFISMYNAKNPNSKASLIDSFVAQYGNKAVATVLTFAKPDDAATMNLVITLQKQQFLKWKEGGISANSVFRLLDIHFNDLLPPTNPKFDTLSGYLATLNNKNLLYNEGMLRAVSKGFGGEDELAIQTTRAREHLIRNGHADLDEISIATEYQRMLFGRWFKRETEPSDIYGTIFRSSENTASNLERATAARYKDYYKKKMAPPHIDTSINPRR
ncbi:hypothetical protein PInf_008344 [Phytophthora infestans]|nr:hypothetical protein PInf_008344 [Phytophthora infestans]